MAEDFRVDKGFFENVKTLRLRAAFGANGIVWLWQLWAWATHHKPDGNLTGMTNGEIAAAARVPKRYSEKWVLLIMSGPVQFIDCGQNGEKNLHGWSERNPFVFHSDSRKEIAKHAAKVRWAKKHNNLTDAPSIAEHCSSDAQSNAPIPIPIPIPTPTPNPNPEEPPLIPPFVDNPAEEEQPRSKPKPVRAQEQPIRLTGQDGELGPPVGSGEFPDWYVQEKTELDDPERVKRFRRQIAEHYRLVQKMAGEYGFSEIDLAAHLRDMQFWIASEPRKGEKQNYLRFIRNWLTRHKNENGNHDGAGLTYDQEEAHYAAHQRSGAASKPIPLGELLSGLPGTVSVGKE